MRRMGERGGGDRGTRRRRRRRESGGRWQCGGEKKRGTGRGREGQTCYHSTIYANYILTRCKAALLCHSLRRQRCATRQDSHGAEQGLSRLARVFEFEGMIQTKELRIDVPLR